MMDYDFHPNHLLYYVSPCYGDYHIHLYHM